MSSMDFLLQKDFFQRVDNDGTAWSICLRCFETVASQATWTDVQTAQAVHHCHDDNGSRQIAGSPQAGHQAS